MGTCYCMSAVVWGKKDQVHFHFEKKQEHSSRGWFQAMNPTGKEMPMSLQFPMARPFLSAATSEKIPEVLLTFLNPWHGEL